MEIMDYLHSKVGQNIRIPPVPLMTGKGSNAIANYLMMRYVNHGIDINDNEGINSYQYKVNESISATGHELSDKRGKWTTRFRKELKSRGIALTDQELGRVGDYVMMCTDMDGPWFVDFVDKLDWDDGDFQDEGSCFWTCRANNRDMIEFYRGLAIRTYRSDNFMNGSGRAWICKPNYEANKDIAVIINAYGKRLDKFSHIIKRLCAMDEQVVFENDEVDVHCNGGDFWINSGEGVALSFNDNIPCDIDLNYMDIHGEYTWRENHGGDATCFNCGEQVSPTLDNRFIERMSLRRHTHNSVLLCKDCFNSNDFTYCNWCQTAHPNDHFLQDKSGHRFCIYNATWWMVCSRCGRIHSYDYECFNEYMKFDFDSLRYTCHECTNDYVGHPYQFMYGPICRSCTDYINRRINSYHYSDFFENLMLNLAEKFERKED